ncbi:MAG: hypothetical protein HYZ58_16980 [Acidobacteria bacterium]|nr:hypothetical protein [Acidobacteriota bacterium]
MFQTFLNTTLGRYLACHLPVLVSFALLYWAAIRRQRSPILASYWAEQFPDWHRVLELPAWLVASLVELCNYPYKPAGIAILGLAVAGGLALCRQGKAGLLAVLAAPVVVTLLAACAGQYPFGGSRLTVFLAPAVFLLAGAGVGGIGQRLPPRWSRWWWLLPGTLLAWGLAQAAYHLAVPRTRSHMRPAVEYLRAHRQPGEGIYALYTHGAVFRCYWRQPEPRLRLEMDPVQAIPWRRFWIVFAFPPRRGFREMQPVLDEVQTGAELRDQFVVAGGAALLFEIPPAGEATADGARAGEARAGEAPPGGHPLFSPR